MPWPSGGQTKDPAAPGWCASQPGNDVRTIVRIDQGVDSSAGPVVSAEGGVMHKIKRANRADNPLLTLGVVQFSGYTSALRLSRVVGRSASSG